MKDKYEQAIERDKTANDYTELFRRNKNHNLKSTLKASGAKRLAARYGADLLFFYQLGNFSGISSNLPWLYRLSGFPRQNFRRERRHVPDLLCFYCQ